VLLLAFDTATPAVTVALHDGARVLAEESAVDARRHGELLAASIQRVLAGAHAVAGDLTGIAVGVGPGPYTGLRAGLVTARVLGSALGVPVHGACTLDVIARAAASRLASAAADGPAASAMAAGRDFVVATDARRKEVYWARYTAAGKRVRGPEVSAPGEAGGCCQVAGEGGLLYPGELGAPIEPRYPSAAWLAGLTAERIMQGAPMLPAEPLYLRRPDARIPGPPKRVTP
jgi:tRNA threonylcarbamoyl adenosine modification protein YeaZ